MQESSHFAIKTFDAMSVRELHACLKLRGEVFGVDQQISAVADVDEHDPACQHVMLWRGEELVGTARLLPIDGGAGGGAVVKVGRVAVAVTHRGRGLGTRLMTQVQGWITQVPDRSGVMHAQAHLEPWYTRLGWRPVGERFVEAGIDHIEMAYDARRAP